VKKIGTLNTHLSQAISRMGHGDSLVICDSGLPIPRSAEVVDLALTKNIPRFVDTLRVILEELKVERVEIASQLQKENPGVYASLITELRKAGITKVRKVSHAQFKRHSANGSNPTFVRTGEATPYANIILFSGVTF